MRIPLGWRFAPSQSEGGRPISDGRILAIIGVGLIGGSVALAARKRGLFAEIRGTTRRASTRKAALELGVIDRAYETAGEAADGADMVVVATSVADIPRFCLECAAVAAEGAIITDVGSVKGAIERAVSPDLPSGRHFIGSHPLAGSERTGVVNATAELLAGATCIVAPGENADRGAVDELLSFWRALGVNAVLMSPDEHDCVLAGVSHVPHLAAAALLTAIPDEALPFGASGLRDATRIAAGDAALWRDIVQANQHEVLKALVLLQGQIERVRELVEQGDFPAIEAYLKEAGEKRRRRYDN